MHSPSFANTRGSDNVISSSELDFLISRAFARNGDRAREKVLQKVSKFETKVQGFRENYSHVFESRTSEICIRVKLFCAEC